MQKTVRNFFHRVRGSRPMLYVLACLLFILAAVLIYSAFPGKSPRDFYLAAESKNFKKYSVQLGKMYADFRASQEPYLKDRYKRRSEITVDIKPEDANLFGISDAGGILEAAGKCKLILDTRYDRPGGKTLAKASLLIDRSPLLDAEVFSTGKEAGLMVPVLMPGKCFLFDTDSVDEVFGRFHIPVRPKRLLTKADAAETLFFSPEDLGRVAEEYGKLISGVIGERDVQYGEAVTVQVAGEARKGREVIVSLDRDEAKRLFSEVLSKAVEEDALLKMTFENAAGISNLLDGAGIFQAFHLIGDVFSLNDNIRSLLESLRVKQDLEGFKKVLRNLAAGTEFPEGFRMKVVIDKSGNLLDRRISLTLRGISAGTNGAGTGTGRGISGGANETATIGTGTNPGTDIDTGGGTGSGTGDKSTNPGTGSGGPCRVEIHSGSTDLANAGFKNAFCDVDLSFTGPKGEKLGKAYRVNTKLAPTSKSGDEKGRVECSYGNTRDGHMEFAIKAGLDINKFADAAVLKKNSEIRYDIVIRGDGPDLEDRFYGEWNTAAGWNKKQKTVHMDTVLTVNADLSTMRMTGLTAQLNTVTEDRFEVEDFNLPDPEGAGAVRLDHITDEELERLKGEVMASFGAFYLNNKLLFDSFLP